MSGSSPSLMSPMDPSLFPVTPSSSGPSAKPSPTTLDTIVALFTRIETLPPAEQIAQLKTALATQPTAISQLKRLVDIVFTQSPKQIYRIPTSPGNSRRIPEVLKNDLRRDQLRDQLLTIFREDILIDHSLTDTILELNPRFTVPGLFDSFDDQVKDDIIMKYFGLETDNDDEEVQPVQEFFKSPSDFRTAIQTAPNTNWLHIFNKNDLREVYITGNGLVEDDAIKIDPSLLEDSRLRNDLAQRVLEESDFEDDSEDEWSTSATGRHEFDATDYYGTWIDDPNGEEDSEDEQEDWASASPSVRTFRSGHRFGSTRTYGTFGRYHDPSRRKITLKQLQDMAQDLETEDLEELPHSSGHRGHRRTPSSMISRGTRSASQRLADQARALEESDEDSDTDLEF